MIRIRCEQWVSVFVTHKRVTWYPNQDRTLYVPRFMIDANSGLRDSKSIDSTAPQNLEGFDSKKNLDSHPCTGLPYHTSSVSLASAALSAPVHVTLPRMVLVLGTCDTGGTVITPL